MDKNWNYRWCILVALSLIISCISFASQQQDESSALTVQDGKGDETIYHRRDMISFMCPEDYRDPEKYMEDLAQYVSAETSINPEYTPEDILRIRKNDLEKHGCGKALEVGRARAVFADLKCPKDYSTKEEAREAIFLAVDRYWETFPDGSNEDFVLLLNEQAEYLGCEID